MVGDRRQNKSGREQDGEVGHAWSTETEQEMECPQKDKGRKTAWTEMAWILEDWTAWKELGYWILDGLDGLQDLDWWHGLDGRIGA